MKSTINLKEIEKFSKIAKNWWNERSDQVKMLHKMNPLRLEYILKQTSIKGKKVLEIGCGGGILSMPLLRLGANLTAIEPSAELCKVAQEKAEGEGLDGKFLNIPLESLQEEGFEVVLLMDVLEHVEEQEAFLKMVESKITKSGILIISTINRTILSKFFVKFIAEDVIRIVPKGTHDSSKFISPQEVCNTLKSFSKLDLRGFSYNPLLDTFKFTSKVDMNYFLTLTL